MTFQRAELLSVKLLSMTIGAIKSTQSMSNFLEVSVLYGSALGSIVDVRSGAGNDIISVEGGSVNVDSGDGNDVIDVYAIHANIDGGSGDDNLTSYTSSANLSGGSGDDKINVISTGAGVNVKGGTGNDTIYLDNGKAFGGARNDHITVNSLNHKPISQLGFTFADSSHKEPVLTVTPIWPVLNGGTGDDNFSLVNNARAVFEYNSGDGHDTIKGATENSFLKLGPGLTFEQTTFSIQDGTLLSPLMDRKDRLLFRILKNKDWRH
ncbi:MAG: hypothetical protein JKY92_01335 [Magnetovibrio sp.]|nr:hypothetical protein [Magnetovibrio sp.]